MMNKGDEVRHVTGGAKGQVLAAGRKWATVQFPTRCVLRKCELEVVRTQYAILCDFIMRAER